MSRNHKTKHEGLSEVVRMAYEDFSSVRTSQIAGVLRAIADAIERVKISLILPKLIDNPDKLKKVLTGTPYTPAIPLIDGFMRRREIILKDQRSPLMDHGMIQIIDYFQMNREMYKLFPKYLNGITANEQKLLTAFQMLYGIAERHLERNSTMQIREERNLNKIYKEIEAIKLHITELKSKADSSALRNRWKLAAKTAVMEKYAKELAENEQETAERIHIETEKYYRNVNANEKSSREKQLELQEALEKARFEYEKVKRENKNVEKISRDEKNKLQIQLEGIIKKYDATIGEKHIENLDLQEQLNVEKKKLAAFMILYRREEAIYNRIVLKREKEEERRKLESILIYSMNRAARKIQRFWRNWRNKLNKKKKRSRTKKI